VPVPEGVGVLQGHLWWSLGAGASGAADAGGEAV